MTALNLHEPLVSRKYQLSRSPHTFVAISVVCLKIGIPVRDTSLYVCSMFSKGVRPLRLSMGIRGLPLATQNLTGHATQCHHLSKIIRILLTSRFFCPLYRYNISTYFDHFTYILSYDHDWGSLLNLISQNASKCRDMAGHPPNGGLGGDHSVRSCNSLA